ncbi:MAG: hypothetical protein D4S01_00585 [Dehalococcoidia bacterium]|nr:MAG: hypothetical protein D4S01_00585 [Dehalococcoidia bacterium]
MKEEIVEGRNKIEDELRKLVGNVFVSEAKVFGMACGCVGFAVDLRGLQVDAVEVFTERINALLEDISNSVGITPEFIYARKLPGSDEVVVLTTRELCERCKKEFAGSKASPRPDILVLKRRT